MATVPSFAERQLAKYGWKQGEGLGKGREGIKRAITVSRRTDNRGIGTDASQWNSNWWEHLYNKATDGKSVVSKEGLDEDSITQDSDHDINKITETTANIDTLSEYQGMFVRSSNTNGIKNTETSKFTKKQTVDRTKLVRDGGIHLGNIALTDAELFAACEGRMARKGARAEQSGKLARVMGDGMPRPEVAARIEAALSGKLSVLIEEGPKKPKRRRKDELDTKLVSCKKHDKIRETGNKKEKKRNKRVKTADTAKHSKSTSKKAKHK
ncbi:hypothetical protein COEREDRAFT_79792 [Coemansia reversa NRRL 1564]|uniref:G-patch domain-containing protein n=1 Tax=Coemansia reversa (strain ATCC 12441 / NRRL 1564) TaxID=763665 RepID=A0A2G5BH32_COERN|nr:hypothetical protein COEREDRAFT_79792 [Coemansia reversa NRRL 1564]|eukprot:PIA18291.1 hypothetical protein COEREDRAFT_79792 [Coemansia reversa NRRL 1564]